MGSDITIIDYGAGNLRSVVNAVNLLGYKATVTGDPAEIMRARAVILPGDGNAAFVVEQMRKSGLADAVRKVIAENRPFMGICVGFQVLFDITEEGGAAKCLGIVKGGVRKFKPGLKVPHMGWNQVKQKQAHPIFEGIPDNANFYFVHSYYCDPTDRSLVAGETEYGIPFCSMIVRSNLVAMQFHPEKSGEYGLKMYENFFRSALGGNN